MKHLKVLHLIGILLSALAAGPAEAQPRAIRLALQTRDPKTNEIQTRTEEVDSAKVAVVIVDPWNYHWCMTACERLSAIAPRWNRALQCARELGIEVMWAPTEAASQYAGTPHRERAAAVIAAGSAVLGFPTISRAQSPGDQIVLALIGAGGRASKLVFDGATERFTNNAAANALLKPAYRKHYRIPEQV